MATDKIIYKPSEVPADIDAEAGAVLRLTLKTGTLKGSAPRTRQRTSIIKGFFIKMKFHPLLKNTRTWLTLILQKTPVWAHQSIVRSHHSFKYWRSTCSPQTK